MSFPDPTMMRGALIDRVTYKIGRLDHGKYRLSTCLAYSSVISAMIVDDLKEGYEGSAMADLRENLKQKCDVSDFICGGSFVQCSGEFNAWSFLRWFRNRSLHFTQPDNGHGNAQRAGIEVVEGVEEKRGVRISGPVGQRGADRQTVGTWTCNRLHIVQTMRHYSKLYKSADALRHGGDKNRAEAYRDLNSSEHRA